MFLSVRANTPPLPEQRFAALAILIPATLFVSFLLTWKLWISTRLYPLTPVLRALGSPAFPFDYILFVILLVLLLSAIILPRQRNRKLFFVCIVVIALLGAFDQMRWQPYIYHYIFILGALVFFKDRSDFSILSALHACRIVVAATYFWSGLQKINVSFMQKTIYWLFDPSLFRAFVFLLPHTWFILPLLEMSIGVGLLFARTRRAALAGAVFMHALIFFLLGALKHDLLYVVWVWNICFMLLSIILFWKEESDFRGIVMGKFYSYKGIVILLFMVAPLLGIFHLIDSNLSAAFYSGNLMKAEIYLDKDVVENQPEEIRKHIRNGGLLDIYSWGYTEFKIFIYPELRIFKSIARTFCGMQGDVLLLVREKPYPWSAVRNTTSYRCVDLVQ